MNPRSPTMEGFRAVFRRPSLAFAEIAWRWSFGAAAGLLITLFCFEYLDTLPVTRGDLLLLRSRQPLLILRAAGNIVRGSGFRLVEAFIVLALALTVGWIVVAALARAATVRALIGHFRQSNEVTEPAIRPLAGLMFLRAATSLAAVLSGFAAFGVLGFASTPEESGMAFQLAMVIFGLVWLAWSVVNWFLSLVAIFVVANGQDTFGAIAAAVDFLGLRGGPVFAVGTSFGLAHFAAFIVASIVAAVPLGLAAALPGRLVLAAIIAITLLYLAVADFLYMGRLAAYVAILELPAEESSQPSAVSIQPSGSIDPSELILSDVPAPG
ncbi:MAG: hypothetical protein WBQ09_00835 [Terriglobales bacterium]|jgi:hypothetical protein